MAKKTDFTSSLHLSIRLYQSLISIYPTEFRQDYGEPMVQVFGDCCRRAFREVCLVCSYYGGEHYSTPSKLQSKNIHKEVFIWRNKLLSN